MLRRLEGWLVGGRRQKWRLPFTVGREGSREGKRSLSLSATDWATVLNHLFFLFFIFFLGSKNPILPLIYFGKTQNTLIKKMGFYTTTLTPDHLHPAQQYPYKLNSLEYTTTSSLDFKRPNSGGCQFSFFDILIFKITIMLDTKYYIQYMPPNNMLFYESFVFIFLTLFLCCMRCHIIW